MSAGRPVYRPPRPLRLAAALAAATVPWLPGAWAVGLALLAAIGTGWGRRRADRIVVVLLVAAACALSVDVRLGHDWAAGRAGELARVEAGYQATWAALDRLAERAAAEPPPADGDEEKGQEFLRLADLVADDPTLGASVLLLDPDGEAAAWAGPGLLHEIEALDLPATGRTYRPGYTAATLLAVRPLGSGARPWRAVAGVSLSTETLPFEGGGRPARRAWTLVGPDAPTPDGATRLRAPDGPDLLVARGAAESRPAGSGAWRSVAGLLVTLALLLLAVSPDLRRWLSDAPPGGRALRPRPLPSALAGLAAAGALGLGAAGAALLTGSAAAASAATGARRKRGASAVRGAAEACGASALLLTGVAGLIAAGWNPAAPVGVSFPLDDLGIRFGLSLALFAALAWIGSASGGEARWTNLGRWLGVLLLTGAAALHETSLAAAVLGVSGLALAGAWLGRVGRSRGGSTLAFACVVAALAAGAAVDGVDRRATRAALGERLLPQLGPPSDTEVAALEVELQAWFDDLALERTTPADPEDLDTQDLAFHLWRLSPLARPGALSALVVEPRGAARSSFAFGLPLGENGQVDWGPGLRDDILLPGWENGLVTGSVTLSLAGQEFGDLRYWLLLRPGFRVERIAGEDLVGDLLRGSPALGRAGSRLLGDALYGLYRPSGRPLISPWRESPSLPDGVPGAQDTAVDTPDGSAWIAARRDRDGVEVLFLPRLGVAEALQRSGAHAVSSLAVALVLAVAALLAAIPATELVGRARRALRSYSRRLVLVYSALLLIPLLVVNTVTLRILGERVAREQRRVGEAALDSAQRVLGEYVLTLDPGFGIGTAIDDDLLFWLSEVVDHELNLYWGSSVYASSEPELFTAGLLPKRIPGEIYSRLSLQGYGRSARTNRVGAARYLEVYAPLEVPGVGAQANLFLSMPLLAQQEEVAEEIAALRGKAILVTSGLFLLLLAVSVRLARNFTKPLMQLVEGTQRIAEGASSLGLQPSETELEALVRAVDRMAERIADGRRRLVEEKRVVETVVESITAGVVSLDPGGIVVLRNRVAAELLGVEVGDRLATRLAASERLAAVAAWLGREEGGPRTATFRLAGAKGDEKEWSVVRVPLPGGQGTGALVVVEDVTEVLRGQRLQAWAEMARIIAHEIKNPLTPIQLSTEHMREVYAADRPHFDSVFESCTRNILRQVEELRQISSEFSTYSRIPRFEPRRGELVGEVRGLVESYRSAASAGVEVSFDTELSELDARYDARLLGRALRNLLENALRAASADGAGRVEVRLTADAEEVRIAVADSGPGVPADQLARIFDPYFSTHSGGTGLGLPIARRIAEQHGGGIAARNRKGGGLVVTAWLPLGELPAAHDPEPEPGGA